MENQDLRANLEAQELLESRFAEPNLTVEAIAMAVAVSKRNFIRRFKKATNRTPIQYLQRVRMEAAKRRLERADGTVAEIMYDVGYNDPKTFRQVFRKHTGLTPKQYKDKFRGLSLAVA